jgi:hypothetical protein
MLLKSRNNIPVKDGTIGKEANIAIMNDVPNTVLGLQVIPWKDSLEYKKYILTS